MKNKGKWTLLLITVIAVCITMYLLLFRENKASGLNYIQELENKDTQKISSVLKEKRNEELKQALEQGTVSSDVLLSDCVIFGDSRAMGFSEFGKFASNRVFAYTGQSCTNISDWLTSLEALNPSVMFFSYGANDIGQQLNNMEGGYSAYYASCIQQALNVCPDAVVVVCSIAPVTQEERDSDERWTQLDVYNEQIQAMCNENDWMYFDMSKLCANEEIYASDGIHFVSSFYDTWKNELVLSIVDLL